VRDTRVAPVVFTNDVVDDFETLVADRVAAGTAQERAHVFRWLVTKTTAKSDRSVHGTCGSRAADYFIPIRRVSFISPPGDDRDGDAAAPPSPPSVRLAGATQLAMASHGLHGLHGSTGALPRDGWSSYACARTLQPRQLRKRPPPVSPRGPAVRPSLRRPPRVARPRGHTAPRPSQ
jgi:hypothetical protein